MLTAVWGTQLDQGGAVVEIGMGGRPFIFWGVKAGMILEQLFMFVFLVGLCFLFWKLSSFHVMECLIISSKWKVRILLLCVLFWRATASHFEPYMTKLRVVVVVVVVVGCWLLVVACCLLVVVCCLLFVVCCLFVRCSLFVVGCLLFVFCLFVCCFFSCCCCCCRCCHRHLRWAISQEPLPHSS